MGHCLLGSPYRPMKHQPIDSSAEKRDTIVRCPCCGHASDYEGEPVVKRGAVIISSEPTLVTWNGKPVPLSPTEAQVYAFIAKRGRCTLDEVDDAMSAVGASPATRSLLLGHIRGKFRRLGACDPFERVGPSVLRLRVDPDGIGSTSPVIGLRLPRYVVAGV